MAKLKCVFDKFDSEKQGKLSGSQVEQLLVYMNRPVDSAAVFDILCLPFCLSSTVGTDRLSVV